MKTNQHDPKHGANPDQCGNNVSNLKRSAIDGTFEALNRLPLHSNLTQGNMAEHVGGTPAPAAGVILGSRDDDGLSAVTMTGKTVEVPDRIEIDPRKVQGRKTHG